MDSIIEYSSSQKISKEELKAFEKENNFSLPQDYIDFILRNNGGLPRKEKRYIEIVDMDTGEFEFEIREFYSINYGDSMVLDILSLMAENETIPNYLFPFAGDYNESILCLSLREEDYGTVYFLCIHNTIYGELDKVASNFSDFANNLYAGHDSLLY